MLNQFMGFSAHTPSISVAYLTPQSPEPVSFVTIKTISFKNVIGTIFSKMKNKEEFHNSKISILQSSLDSISVSKASTFFSISPSQFQPCPPDSVFKHLRGYLIFGRIIGIIPIQGVFSSNVEKLRFRSCSLPNIISVAICVLLACCTAVSTVGMITIRKKNPSDIAWSGAQAAFYGYGLFLYVFFRRNSQRLIDLFEEWESTRLYFAKEDSSFKRYIFLTVGIIFSSAILENAALHLKVFPIFDNIESPNSGKPTTKSPLEVYYEKEHNFWNQFFGYNSVLAILLFFANKFAIYAWNYGDILIALISRALFFKFKCLRKVAEDNRKNLGEKNAAEKLFWELVVEDHSLLCGLLEKTAQFLSSLIFASYTINTYITCLLIHQTLTPSSNNSVAARIYSAWAFCQITGRVFVFSLAAARVNEYSKDVGELYSKCPTDFYTLNVQRAEERLCARAKMGLDGLNCFLITKGFLLTIISTVFTFEVVLLSSSSLNNSSS